MTGSIFAADVRAVPRTLALLLGAALTLPAMPAAAQTAADEGLASLEEVIVTARKREENLQDVPVAISVFSKEGIAESGIFNAQDLFDASVGFKYDSGWGDRNTANPGVRGVQGNGLGVTQQKMNSFLDGFPLVGQQGSLGFTDVARVELYRGPQSAAFGRATFAGAVNYVSRDPGEAFKAKAELGTSNMKRNTYSVALDGPITRTLGFTLDYSSEAFQGPDEWRSTDGYHLAATNTKYGSAKVVWKPTDKITTKLRYINQKNDDLPGNRSFITPAAFAACTNYTTPAGRAYYQGDVASACNLGIPATGITRNHDVPASAGLKPGDPNYLLALSVSVLTPFARDERERLQLEFDYDLGVGSIQVLAMDAKEYTEVWQDGDYTAARPVFSGVNKVIAGANTTVGPQVSHMSNPYHIEEKYYEVRWISPTEKKLRYMLGATRYKAAVPGEGNFVTAGVLLGLDGVAIQGRAFGPSNVYGDGITNTGAFGSIAYDFAHRITVHAEARYQQDVISNVNNLEGNKVLENKTKSFSPRLSVTHKLGNGMTVYGQFSQGTNPAGVNIGYTFDAVSRAITQAKAAGYVTYDQNTFKNYEEEKLTNYEVGLKGSAFGNRLNFSAALYRLKWENQTNTYTVSWDGDWNNPLLNGGKNYGFVTADLAQRTTLNEGTVTNTGVEFEGNYRLTNKWGINGNLELMRLKYERFCDVLAAGGNFAFKAAGKSPTTGVACVVMDGNTPPLIPTTSYSFGLAYRTGVANTNWNVSSRLDLRHTGDMWMDTANIMKIGGFDMLSGSVSLTNKSVTLRLWGNNLTNNLTPHSVSLGTDYNQGSSGPRNLLIAPQKPREYGLSASYAF